ncbi:MAG: hypothetical protein JWQ20_4092 [Conexibacter sp.]|nr:hypothetical protein [Solirubrobacterales bacterium]MCW3004794.1 hypothetical protein [Conexibacter sp.]
MTALTVRETTDAAPAAPPSLSRRGVLVDALPPVYRERATPDEPTPFVERWVHSCSLVLDPVVALLDNLPAYIDPHTAPDEMVDALLAFVGMRWPAAVEPAARRRLLLEAKRISRTRGTLAGLRLALWLVLPHCGISVTHTGRVTTGADPAAPGPDAAAPAVEITCERPLTPAQRAALRAVIDDQLPVHIPCRIIAGREAP